MHDESQVRQSLIAAGHKPDAVDNALAKAKAQAGTAGLDWTKLLPILLTLLQALFGGGGPTPAPAPTAAKP